MRKNLFVWASVALILVSPVLIGCQNSGQKYLGDFNQYHNLGHVEVTNLHIVFNQEGVICTRSLKGVDITTIPGNGTTQINIDCKPGNKFYYDDAYNMDFEGEEGLEITKWWWTRKVEGVTQAAVPGDTVKKVNGVFSSINEPFTGTGSLGVNERRWRWNKKEK